MKTVILVIHLRYQNTQTQQNQNQRKRKKKWKSLVDTWSKSQPLVGNLKREYLTLSLFKKKSLFHLDTMYTKMCMNN